MLQELFRAFGETFGSCRLWEREQPGRRASAAWPWRPLQQPCAQSPPPSVTMLVTLTPLSTCSRDSIALSQTWPRNRGGCRDCLCHILQCCEGS